MLAGERWTGGEYIHRWLLPQSGDGEGLNSCSLQSLCILFLCTAMHNELQEKRKYRKGPLKRKKEKIKRQRLSPQPRAGEGWTGGEHNPCGYCHYVGL